MTDQKEIFTITPTQRGTYKRSNSCPSNGILKPSSPTTKVNQNPNWKTPSGNGVQPRLKRARPSTSSLASSTGDASEKEVVLHPRKRCQRRLSVLLHTHVVLIIVCSLAALDAVCVIGQLICDILIMREKLDHFEHIDDELTELLRDCIPGIDWSTHAKWNLDAILSVMKGTDDHLGKEPVPSNTSGCVLLANGTSIHKPLMDLFSQLEEHTHHISKRAAEGDVPGHEVDHGLLYHMTHTFHLGSMVILSLLLLETLLKVFAMGIKLRHHKLEVFDALVVAISWSLDVAFWEGIWAHPGTTAATLLIYLLPWRVVRIVNSFVLVIQEKDHVQLKIVKQRLRYSIKRSKEFNHKAFSYKHEVKALAGLCRKLGASEGEITACSPSGKAGRRGSIHSVLERAASLTFISTLSSMGSYPSLFDMGDSSSDEEDPRIQHKDLQKSASNDPTLRSAFSSTTLDSNSVVFCIDNEEVNALENPVFDTSSRSSTSSSSKDEDKKDKSNLEKTDSNTSEPPSYHVAVAKTNSDTRL